MFVVFAVAGIVQPPVVVPERSAMDVGFVLDSSSSIGSGWRNVQQFAQSITDQLNPSSRGNHVGIVNFGESASVALGFNSLSGKDISAANVKNRISGISTGGRYTMINKGLATADQQLFNTGQGMREGVRKVKFVFIIVGLY